MTEYLIMDRSGQLQPLFSDDTFTLAMQSQETGELEETTPESLANYFEFDALLHLSRKKRLDSNDIEKLSAALRIAAVVEVKA